MWRRILCLLLLFIPAASRAAVPPRHFLLARSEEVSVSLREKGRGAYEITGEFSVTTPRPAVWAVLTDYEHIEVFVSSVRSSRVVERREDGIMIEQKNIGKALFFSKQVSLWLRIKEKPPGEISFEEVSHKDFESYKGQWLLEETASGCRVTYRLQAQPKFAAPAWIIRKTLRKTAQNLLEEVRREIVRRADPTATKILKGPVAFAGDLGPAEIDVPTYPRRMQDIYHRRLL